MRRAFAAALFAFAACAPFAGANDVPADPADDDGSAKKPGSDAHTPEAGKTTEEGGPIPGVDAVAPFVCPNTVLQCEDFTTGFSSLWQTFPDLGLFTHFASEDPIHGGVVVHFTHLESPVEDRLENGITLNAAAQDLLSLRLDFLLRIDMLSKGQSVEIAKIIAEEFLVHINLNAPDDGAEVIVNVSQYSIKRSRPLGIGVPVGKISDHAWHRVHLELSTGNKDPIANQFRGGVDGSEGKTDKLSILEEEATAKTNSVRWVVGLSHVEQFKAETKYAIDEVVVTR